MASMILNGGKKPKPGADIVKEAPTVNPDTIIDPPVTNLVATGRSKAMTLPKGNEADMQKVRDYQIKLNKKGANLVVDGIWGDKTAAASRDYYNKYQKQAPSVSKSGDTKVKMRLGKNSTLAQVDPNSADLPKGDKEFKSIKDTLPDTPAAQDYFTNRNKTKVINNPKRIETTDDLYDSAPGKEITTNGITGKPIAGNAILYPNGRVKNQDGSMNRIDAMDDVKLSRRKSAIQKENESNEKEINNSKNLGPLGKKIMKLVTTKRETSKGYKPLIDLGETDGVKEYKRKMKLKYK